MYGSTRPRLLAVAIIVIACAAAVALTARDLRLASSQTVTLVARRSPEAVPLDDPSAEVWKRGAPVDVPLSAQNTVPPMGGGEGAITARALHDGSRLYIRVEWDDDAADASTDQQTEFSDGAAVQFPVAEGEQVPPFCMGDPNAPVNIWHWKAAWQRDVEQAAVLEEAHPNTYVDQYPFEDEEDFDPSRAADNVVARVNRDSPIDNLLAGSFGTLTAASDQMIAGRGEWDDGRWRVVFARDLAVDGEYTQFEVGERANVAFAVWDGDEGQRDGMKSVSQFLTLDVSEETAEVVEDGFGIPRRAIPYIIIGGLAVILAGALGYLTLIQRRRA